MKKMMAGGVSGVSRLVMAVMGSLPVMAVAQQSAPAADATELKPVVVTATRSQVHANDVAGTVTAVTQKQIEQHGSRSLADALADEPDVSLPSDPRRFGSSHVNIRGIEENRVLMLTDGVRVADFRSPGTTNYDASNRDIPFVEFLKQVEVVRGPSSSLYGSDAIGGVLGFLTLDPADLLKGRSFATGGKLGYHSVDNSKRAMAYVATGGDKFQTLLMLGHAKGEESDNQGANDVQGLQRSTPNPLKYEQSNVLGKLVFTPNMAHRFKLTLEHKEGESEIDAQRMGNTSATSPNTLTRITTNTGIDSITRDRIVFDHDYTPDASWFDRLGTKLYTQKQTTDNQNFQRRTNTSATCSASTIGTANCSVDQRFKYEQTHTGLNLLQEKSFTLGLPQQAIWGADFLRSETEESKTTTWTNLATGVSSNVFIGEVFPKADYPRGHTDQLGLFVQDEISFGQFKLTPGLRYDQFKLQPESDPLYNRTDGRTAVSKDGRHISPKLAALYGMSADWNLYAQYLEGYRGPNYEEVNRYFYNNSQRYALVGNPDLKPETSRSFEIGSKYSGKHWGSQFALYENRYQNFIDSVILPAGDPNAVVSGGVTFSTYQYQNLSRVVIRGGDWRGYWQATPALRLSAGFAITHGYDQSSGKPLNSIEPKRMNLAAQWTPSEQWGAEWRLRAAAGKDHIDDSSTNYYRTPGYGVNDLAAWWQVQPKLRVNLALNNVFDKTYYLWSDVRRSGMSASDPSPEFYTQPGRNIALSVKFDY
ncbi:TonB-dependent hemoglobin/transferrin/lactoferrin family receptor [Uliginosibacterium sp. 31-16]|uniref:TonB-dependent hemoglobin/transferrin/lactoferrin family receptor n=1 Tax=Uliginosibacterium sp. 31-16 TaxID=3068315 RepID=UPI00273F87B5|nr:TonB-dependent hemoglobin/transferrin/lactoferrin family receptor [Uliginosibacterium sp. 31-16]MDP5238348.1 TonB-dependent hemoglobin/transferrin/lactoferrin family receptor [Uliginosibacterium sp. 31-16]